MCKEAYDDATIDALRSGDAAACFGEAFAGRRVIQVAGTEIAFGGGCIHCITQQQPVGDVTPAAAEVS